MLGGGRWRPRGGRTCNWRALNTPALLAAQLSNVLCTLGSAAAALVIGSLRCSPPVLLTGFVLLDAVVAFSCFYSLRRGPYPCPDVDSHRLHAPYPSLYIRLQFNQLCSTHIPKIYVCLCMLHVPRENSRAVQHPWPPRDCPVVTPLLPHYASSKCQLGKAAQAGRPLHGIPGALTRSRSPFPSAPLVCHSLLRGWGTRHHTAAPAIGRTSLPVALVTL